MRAELTGLFVRWSRLPNFCTTRWISTTRFEPYERHHVPQRGEGLVHRLCSHTRGDRNENGAPGVPPEGLLRGMERPSHQRHRVGGRAHRTKPSVFIAQNASPPSAIFSRFRGLSNRILSGSKAAGSNLPPIHSSISSCSSCVGSPMMPRKSS